jgi:Na+:H+ antiporter
MGVELAFGIAGGIILIGVLANLVAKKFGVPDIPLLIGLGILLGPFTGIIQTDSLNSIAPTFAALAITVIVFEGGIHLRIARVAAQAGRATILAIGGYLLSVLFVGVAMAGLLGWPLIDGMILGSALGGSSSVVVFSLLKRASPSERAGALLSLESSLTDVPVLVVTLSLIPLVLGTGNESLLTLSWGIFQSFVIGGIVGVAGGVAWLKMLDKMEDEPYRDIATLGFLLGAYSVASAMNGSGVMCALIIGLIMGNGPEVRKLVRLGENPLVEGVSKRFHEQISFALTTFFFVYLGLFFSLADPTYLLVGGVVSLVLFAARYVAVMVSTAGNSILRMDTWIMTAMFPRGLSNAVMAQVFLTLAFPLAGPLVEVLLSSILWTVIASSLIVVLVPNHLTFHLNLSKLGGEVLAGPLGEGPGPCSGGVQGGGEDPGLFLAPRGEGRHGAGGRSVRELQADDDLRERGGDSDFRRHDGTGRGREDSCPCEVLPGGAGLGDPQPGNRRPDCLPVPPEAGAGGGILQEVPVPEVPGQAPRPRREEEEAHPHHGHQSRAQEQRLIVQDPQRPILNLIAVSFRWEA